MKSRKIEGRLHTRRGLHHVRVTIGVKKRTIRRLHDSLDEVTGDVRSRQIGELVTALRDAGHDSFVQKAIDDGAAADEATFAKIVATVRGLCAGHLRERPAKPATGERFQTFAERWTKGELARTYPDHVKKLRSMSDNKARLEAYVYPKIGDKPIDEVTLEHCLDVMAALPEKLSLATRRHVAQVIHRLFSLAVFPARLIKASPLPRGFLPRIGAPKAKGFIFPNEEAKTLGSTSTPIELRMLLGFLHREGCRKEEGATLEWGDNRAADAAGWIDLDHGRVYLDDHKTVDSSGARDWPLDPSVAIALKAWRKMRPKARFVFGSGDAAANVDRLAAQYRAALLAAGVDRRELHFSTATRQRIVAHDTRGVFITISMASGRSESWIMDRTGHTTSAMLAKYRRRAEGLSEGSSVALTPLDQAVPELAAYIDAKPSGTGSRGDGSDSRGDRRRGTPRGRRQFRAVKTATLPECPGTELNCRHADFQSAALPTELPGRGLRREHCGRRRRATLVATGATSTTA